MCSMLSLNRNYDVDTFNTIDINMFKVRNNDTALVFYFYFEHYFNAMDDLHCIKIMFKVNNKKLKQYRYYLLRTCPYKFCLNIPVQSQE